MKSGARLFFDSPFFALCILSLFFFPPTGPQTPVIGISAAHADRLGDRISQLRLTINQMIKNGTYVPALARVKLYVRLVSKKYGTRHLRYASALQLQAKVYRYLGRIKLAQRYESRASAIRLQHKRFGMERQRELKNRLKALRERKARMRQQMMRERMLVRKKKKPVIVQRKNILTDRRIRSFRKGESGINKPVPGRIKPVPYFQKQAPKSKAAPHSRPRPVYKPIPRYTKRASPSPSGQASSYKNKNVSGRTAPKSRRQATRKILAPPPAARAARSRTPAAPKPRAATSPPAPYAGTAAPVTMMKEADREEAMEEAMEEAAPDQDKTKKAEAPKNHTIVKVYYATDRNRTSSVKLAGFFGGEPSDPKRISYGICEVSIPKGHKAGELEAPSIWRFEWREDPDKHVVLLKIHPQEKKSYFNNLKHVINRSKGKNAFIFIHGYNVTFKDAARRTAQIAYDLKFDGAPVFYSWPSKGELGGYPTDEDNILWAQENVKQFLKDFVQTTNAKNIYLIAHSMGSRALTGAVGALVNEMPRFKKRFREIILAAPDINARNFKDNIAPKMIEASKNVTLYVSGDDKALLASREFHNNPRAGEAGDNMILYKGIDTIDATGIDASLLGHSYFAEAQSIISDIWSVLRGTPPANRKTLKQVRTKRGNYWTFNKSAIAQ